MEVLQTCVFTVNKQLFKTSREGFMVESSPVLMRINMNN